MIPILIPVSSPITQEPTKLLDKFCQFIIFSEIAASYTLLTNRALLIDKKILTHTILAECMTTLYIYWRYQELFTYFAQEFIYWNCQLGGSVWGWGFFLLFWLLLMSARCRIWQGGVWIVWKHVGIQNVYYIWYSRGNFIIFLLFLEIMYFRFNVSNN